MTIMTNPSTQAVREHFAAPAQEAPVQVQMPDGSTITDETRKAIVRDDKIVGMHRAGYQIHQFSDWLVDHVETMLDTPDLVIDRAGTLKGGRVAFVQVSTADTLDVAGIEYSPFINAATSHDGSIASSYFTGATSIICMNTLSAGLRYAPQRISIRHTRHSEFRGSQVREALNIVESTADEFSVAVRGLLDRKVTASQWDEFVSAHTGVDTAKEGRGLTMALNRAESLRSMYRDDERVAPWAGTAYGVLAAVNTWGHWERRTLADDRAEQNAWLDIRGTRFTDDAQAIRLLDKVTAHA